jgi:CDP-glucose 4,6-dehydratase
MEYRQGAVETVGMNESIKRDFWRDRSVLVTGATGLLGSWMVPRLVTLGADVVCFVRDWVPHSKLLSGDAANHVTMVRGDINDQECLERILSEYEIDVVEHLAAQTIVGVALNAPAATFETNIGGTWRMLEACRRVGVKHVVVASSDKAYGEHVDLPYDEDMPLNARHPYDASKSCADIIAQTYASTYRLNVAITRCGNFFGGGDLNWNRLFPGTIRSILRGKRPVIRSDGSFVRDYIYIEDAVEAYLDLSVALVQRPELSGQAFNFSTESPISALAAVEMILVAMGSTLKPDIRDEARAEIRCQYLSSKKARGKLGWTPIFSMDEALRRTISWYRDYLGKRR